MKKILNGYLRKTKYESKKFKYEKNNIISLFNQKKFDKISKISLKY